MTTHQLPTRRPGLRILRAVTYVLTALASICVIVTTALLYTFAYDVAERLPAVTGSLEPVPSAEWLEDGPTDDGYLDEGEYGVPEGMEDDLDLPI